MCLHQGSVPTLSLAPLRRHRNDGSCPASDSPMRYSELGARAARRGRRLRLCGLCLCAMLTVGTS